MRGLVEWILIAAGVLVPTCSGQALLDEVNFKSGQLGGVRLLGVSLYSGYSTKPSPEGGLSLSAGLPGLSNLGADMNYGASASMGWQRHKQGTDVSVLYSGSYGGLVRYSGLNGFSQNLSISVVRKLTPRWTFSLSGSGQDATMAQYLFQPSSLSVITQLPTSFDDLAAALSVGKFSSSQAASLLTGAPLLQIPGRSLLMGNRVLSYSAQASLGYSVSSRLQLHFGSFAAAGQTRLGAQEGVAPVNYVMPRSMGADGGIGFSYSLTPRTEVGASVDANRTVNHFQSVYITSASGSLGRKMGEHWFLRVQGGGAYSVVTQQTLGTPKSRQMTGGGSLGFRTRIQTLVASYDRGASDSFGLAVGTVTTMSGAWNWHPAGSRWSLFSSFGEQQTRNAGFTSLSGWQSSTGITTSLGGHTTVSAQYVYMNSTGTYVGVFNNLAIHSVRLSLGWAPQVAQR